MKFWASEVKSGEAFKVTLGENMILHLSQANLGEVKKGKCNEPVHLFVNVDGQKLVLGTLSSENLPHQQFDLLFDRDFELSHSWKGGSVYFYGYRLCDPEDEDEGDERDSSSEDDDLPLSLENFGKPETKVKEEKPADAQKVEKDSSSDEDEDEDEDDDDDSEDEPAKAEPEKKKRASEKEAETPAATKKKAKLTTPEKTDDGKKKGSGGVRVDTPHPSKKGGKSSGGGGSHVCKSCSRSFGSENALDSHTKAKHGTAAK